jgi:ABC-type transport system substrate-binding protein
MACCDQSLPGPALQTASKAGKQFQSQPAGGVYFLTLNPKFKPLNNVNVRRAISALMNRQAFLLTLGGRYAADPATGFIPKGLAGYAPNEGSKFDFVRNLNGSAAVAKKYMLLAKKQGVPVSASGQYTGSANLTLMGINTDPASKAPLLLQSVLQQLGIHSTVKLVSNEAYQSKYCYFSFLVPAVCTWNSCFKDFPDAIGIDSIFAKSSGLTGVAIPSSKIQAAVSKAINTLAGSKRDAAWQHVNDLVTASAVSIPFAWPRTTTVLSKNVVGAHLNPLYSGAGFDLTFANVK